MIKIGPCLYPLHNKSHRCFGVLEDGTIQEDIYLYSDCDENHAERVLLHESIHAILYHLLDEEQFTKLMNKGKIAKINVNNYLNEFVSTKYDAWDNWFSTLLEEWNFEDWNFG